MNFISASFLLFLLMDPIGSIQTYLRLNEVVAPRRRHWFLFREMGFALLLMFLFAAIGEYILQFLELSEAVISITIGVILFLFAIQVLFPREKTHRSHIATEETLIIPLAVPLVAGPALLMTIMLFAHQEPGVLPFLGSIFAAWACAYAVFLLSPLLLRIVKRNGLMALEKLMAMILILLALQRFLNGVTQWMDNL